MSRKHLQFWPRALPHELTSPATNLFYNAEVSAARYPDKPFLDSPIASRASSPWGRTICASYPIAPVRPGVRRAACSRIET